MLLYTFLAGWSVLATPLIMSPIVYLKIKNYLLVFQIKNDSYFQKKQRIPDIGKDCMGLQHLIQILLHALPAQCTIKMAC
jgi:hypothetical protein